MTEEEEWHQLNERLRIREQERLERERKQAEDDAKKLEEVSKVCSIYVGLFWETRVDLEI